MRTNRPSNADILSNPKTPGSMRMHRERWGIMHRSKEHVQDGEASHQVVKKVWYRHCGLSPGTGGQSGVRRGSCRIEATELRSILRVLDELRHRVLLHVN